MIKNPNRLIKFVIPSEENDEQIKSNLRTSIYYKIHLVANMVQDELRNKSTGIVHSDLIITVRIHTLIRISDPDPHAH